MQPGCRSSGTLTDDALKVFCGCFSRVLAVVRNRAARLPRFFAGGPPPALVRQSLAQRTTMLCNEAYASLASGVTHGALWSAEQPTTASLAAAGAMPRQSDFHPDQRLPEADQAQLADYRRSGFDRGLMTPSGDMPTETAQEQSFSLSNIVPQTAKLNRSVWERIEAAVRDLASREGELYVVTGAAFQGQHLQAIGPDGVLCHRASGRPSMIRRQAALAPTSATTR